MMNPELHSTELNQRDSYQAPAVVFDGDIEVRAGSYLSLPYASDIFKADE